MENAIDLRNTSLTLHTNEKPQTATSKLGASDLEGKAKLVFLFDISWSMSDRVGENLTDQYVWSDAVINQFYDDCIKARDTWEAAQQGDPVAVLELANDAVLRKVAAAAVGADATILASRPADWAKDQIIAMDLIGRYKVEIRWEKHTKKPPRKIDLVRRLGRQEIMHRLTKYPDADVVAIMFNHDPTMIFDSRNVASSVEDELNGAIDALQISGGTKILRALHAAFDAINLRPSEIFVHHIVVVSDGEDNVRGLGKWVGAFKQAHVVLDYIHIGNSYWANGILRTVCEKTGGEFVVVTNEREFEERFVEAARRKLLTA
ncbi:MAG: VWA domain-containing protein [Candidatus Thorarchaeota archaeon]